MSQYAKVPLSAISDDRLTFRQFKVLCALLSFADKRGQCNPSREQIAIRSGVDLSHVTRTTASLVELGWVLKIGTGGNSRATNYTVKTPEETCADLAHVSSAKPEPIQHVNVSQNSAPSNDSNLSRFGPGGCADLAHPPCADLAQGKEQTIEQTNEQTMYAAPIKIEKRESTPSAPKKSALSEEMSVACKRVWESYSMAYSNRYGIDPVKNAKSAGQVVQFVKRIGMDDAPHVAAHYLTSSARWYVTIGHSTDALLRDAEKLRMEWATNRRITSESARQADATQSNFSAAEQAKALLANRRASV